MVVAHSPHPALHNALLRHIVTPVIETAGYRANVQPGTATASINLRLLPGGVDVAQTLAEIRAALGEGITVDIKAPGQASKPEPELLAELSRQLAAAPATVDSDVYRALVDAAAVTFPGAPVTPVLFEAGTSANPWRRRGVPVYGITPTSWMTTPWVGCTATTSGSASMRCGGAPR